ncbi:unnamed protein product [Brassica rapa subsp. narinosa]
MALSGYLSGTGAVGRESLWVGVDSFSRLLRSLEVASVFPDLGFGLRVTASGAPVRLGAVAARLSFFSVINVLSYRLVGSSAFEPVSSLFLARALETVDDVCASLGSSSFLFAWWFLRRLCSQSV